MKGTWKENLAGWNHKGDRRKKTSRKHIIKEKFHAYLRKGLFDNVNEKTIIEKTKVYDTFLVKIKNFSSNFHYAYSHRQFFEINKNTDNGSSMFKLKKNISIGEFLVKKIETGFVSEKNVIYDAKDLEFIMFMGSKTETETWEINKNYFQVKQEYVMYNKPLKFVIFANGYDSNRRTFFSKYFHGSERTTIRNWLAKSDFDSELKIAPVCKCYSRIIC